MPVNKGCYQYNIQRHCTNIYKNWYLSSSFKIEGSRTRREKANHRCIVGSYIVAWHKHLQEQTQHLNNHPFPSILINQSSPKATTLFIYMRQNLHESHSFCVILVSICPSLPLCFVTTCPLYIWGSIRCFMHRPNKSRLTIILFVKKVALGPLTTRFISSENQVGGIFTEPLPHC